MVGGEIKVVLSMDDKDFSVKVEKAGNTLKEMRTAVEQTATSTKNIESHLNAFGDGLTRLTFNISVARFMLRDLNDIVLALPRSIIESTASLERMTVMLKGLSKEVEETKKNAEALKGVNFIFDIAQKTPFSVNALSDSFIKLKIAGIDPTSGAMRALTDDVAKFGGNSETLKHATLAIQQMANKGVVSMEELRRQLGEAVPNAMEAMATGLGMSIGKLNQAVSKGTVESRNAIKQMLTVMSFEAADSGKKMMETWDGMQEQLKAKWAILSNDIGGGTGGLFETSKKYFKEFLEAFDDPKVKAAGHDIADVFKVVITGLAEGIKFLREYGEEIKNIAYFALLYKGAMQAVKIGQSVKGSIDGAGENSALRESRVAAETKLMESRRLRAAELAEEIAANNKKIEAARQAMTMEVGVTQDGENQKLQIQRRAAAENLAYKKQMLQEAENQLLQEQERHAELIRNSKGGAKEEVAKWRESAAAEVQSLNERIERQRQFAAEAKVLEAQQTEDLALMVARRNEIEAQQTAYIAAENAKRTQIRLQYGRTIEQTTVAQAAAKAIQAAEQEAMQQQMGAINALIVAKERDIAATKAQGLASEQNVAIYGQWSQAAAERLRILSLSGATEERVNNAVKATANVTQANIEKVRQLINARKEEVNQAQQNLANTAKATAATVAEASAVNQVRLAHEANIAAMVRANEALTATAARTAQVTFGVRLMSGAIAGTQMVFNAFGGWVGIALMALTYLGTKLYEFLNRWERAKEIADQIKGGNAVDEGRIKELMSLRDDLEGRVSRGKGLVKSGAGSDDAERSRIKAQLQADETALAEVKAQILRARELSDDAAAKNEARGVAKRNEEWMENHNAAVQARIGAIKEGNRKEYDAAKTASEREKVAEKLSGLLFVAMREGAAEEVSFWQKKTDDARKVFENYKGVVNVQSRTAQAVLNDAAEHLAQAKGKLDSAMDLGKRVDAPGKTGQPSLNREEPIIRLAEKAEADWHVAEAKLRSLQSEEATTLEELKKQSTIELIGKIIHGDFDYIDHQGKTAHYLDLGERKKLMSEFLSFTREGKGTADDFVRSIKGLSEENKQAALSFIQSNAQTDLANKQMNALKRAAELATGAHAELAASQNNVSTPNATTAVDKMSKQFEELRKRVNGATDSLEEFDKNRKNAMSDITQKTVLDFAKEGKQDASKASEIQASDSGDKAVENATIKREEALKKLEKEMTDLKRVVNDNAENEAQKIEQTTALEEAAANKRKLIWATYYKEARTPMQQLERSWADTTAQMNTATTDWAKGFMTEFQKAMTGHKANWKKFLTGMLEDIYAMQLKKVFGKQITGMFDSLGASIGGALGLKASGEKAAGETAAQALSGKSKDDAAKTAEKGMFDSVKEKFSGLLDSAKQGFSSLVNNIGSMFSGVINWISNGFASLFASNSGGSGGGLLGAIGGVFGGGSGASAGEANAASHETVDEFDFANGGVMTRFGSLPLRKYAMGGIANRPQVAVYGEGSMSEAFVPLPDGRSIPVTIRSTEQRQQPVVAAPNVVVNVINQTGQQVGAQQSQRYDGKQMILDVVLTAANSPGPFRDGMKNAMR